MTKVSLQFFGQKEIELGEAIFFHPLLENPVLAVRGRSAGAHSGRVSFPWGSVAKAFALLMLRAKLLGAAEGVLEGGQSSLASSLDYAISKPPVWFQELFGNDRFGVTLARRIFQRTNPERKRPGPVRIALNSKQLSPENIEVRWNGEAVDGESFLRELLGALEASLERNVEVRENVAPAAPAAEAPDFDFKGRMSARYSAEISRSLLRPEIFSRASLLAEVSSLKSNPSFKRILSRPEQFLADMTEDLPSGVRLGCLDPKILDRELRGDNPLTVWVTAVQPTNYALVRYLADVKGYNIEIDFRFNYGTEIARQTVDPGFGEGPDICFAGVGPGIHIYNHSGGRYRPWLLAPTLSHAIIAHHHAEERNYLQGDYYFVVEDPTTASFCYDHLCREGTINRRAVKITHAEPEDAIALYHKADEDFRSLAWFPHYDIYDVLFGAKTRFSKANDAYNQYTVAFAHERLRADTARFAAFQAALRDAWLTLRASPAALQQMVSSMMDDDEYTKFVSRACGLHNLDAADLRAASKRASRAAANS